MEVYDPGVDPEPETQRGGDTVVLPRQNQELRIAAVRLESFIPKRGQTLPIRFQTPLAQLAAGRYTCQINLIDETGHKFSFHRSDIVVLPATRPAAAPAPVKPAAD